MKGMTMNEKNKTIQFPAVVMVHTPSGPTPACENHAMKLAKLFHYLGAHVNTTPLESEMECANCVNQQKKREQQ